MRVAETAPLSPPPIGAGGVASTAQRNRGPAGGTLPQMVTSMKRWMSVLLVLIAGAAPAIADQWYEHYARAQRALADGDHATAIAELNRALERRGDSGVRVRTYGMRVVDYFPYLNLGIAYVQAEEYQAALRAFSTEEQLGAVQQSDEASAELERYRRQAVEAVERQQEERQRAIDDLVATNLAAAANHRQAGRLTEALAAVDRALAVAPDNEEAAALAGAIRNEIGRQQHEASTARQAAELIDNGRQLRVEGRLTEAAANFRRALELAPEGAAGELLTGVQRELADRTGAVVPSGTENTLDDAAALLERGDFEAGLALVQQVLAVEPDQDRAAELEAEALDGISRRNRAERISQLLSEARDHLAADDPDGALIAANLVLALERGHEEALAVIRQAYAGLSRRLLGDEDSRNLPPAIRFAERLRQTAGDSADIIVTTPRHRVTGVVIDETAVTVRATVNNSGPVAVDLARQVLGGVTITEFRLDAELASGATSVVVEATDEEGLSSRGEITLAYRPPPLRSPWLWSALVALVVAALALRWTRAHYRRRQLRRRRYNPYIAGPPVLDPALFVGRDELIDRVLATVPNNSLLLLGERRIGKTSTLQQLRRRLPELDHPHFCFVPAAVDLQGVTEEDFFATLAEAVGEATGDERMAEASSVGGYDSRDFMRDLRRALPAVECPDGRHAKLVLLMDEIDELNGYSHRTNQRLRSLFMRSFGDRLVAVAAGVGIDREWEHEGSPWYNFFEELEVGPVDHDAARRLVIAPLAGVIEIDDEAVERILAQAAGRPYLIQKIALAALQRVHASDRGRITLDDVESVV